MIDYIKIIIVICLLLFATLVKSQDVELGRKVWYSNYTFVKINSRFSIDNFLVFSFDKDKNNRFGFAQTDLGLNYHYNKKLKFFIAYSNSQFRYSDFYLKRYKSEPNSLGFMTFQRLGLGVQYIWKINRNFKLTNKLVGQYYFPTLEKYKFRYVYITTLAFKHRKLPLKLKPFVQSFLYYYSGGLEYDYINTNNGLVEPASPNGIHRVRFRGGASIKPFSNFKPLSLKIYYGIQKEFNTRYGNDINVQKIGTYTGNVYTKMKFNNYSIFGLQLNLVF